jgi:hypothetical protein
VRGRVAVLTPVARADVSARSLAHFLRVRALAREAVFAEIPGRVHQVKLIGPPSSRAPGSCLVSNTSTSVGGLIRATQAFV